MAVEEVIATLGSNVAEANDHIRVRRKIWRALRVPLLGFEAMDTALDFIYATSLLDQPGAAARYWGLVLFALTSLSLSWTVFQHVFRPELFDETSGVPLFSSVSFVLRLALEDSTTILIMSIVGGAYDGESLSDQINLIISIAATTSFTLYCIWDVAATWICARSHREAQSRREDEHLHLRIGLALIPAGMMASGGILTFLIGAGCCTNLLGIYLMICFVCTALLATLTAMSHFNSANIRAARANNVTAVLCAFPWASWLFWGVIIFDIGLNFCYGIDLLDRAHRGGDTDYLWGIATTVTSSISVLCLLASIMLLLSKLPGIEISQRHLQFILAFSLICIHDGLVILATSTSEGIYDSSVLVHKVTLGTSVTIVMLVLLIACCEIIGCTEFLPMDTDCARICQGFLGICPLAAVSLSGLWTVMLGVPCCIDDLWVYAMYGSAILFFTFGSICLFCWRQFQCCRVVVDEN